MTGKLIYKEFKLSAHPTNYIFLLFGAMLLIPSYIYFVPLIYIALTVFFVFLSDAQNNTMCFTAVMPVTKADTVKARCSFVAIIELMHIAASVPFAIIGHHINPFGGNTAGMDANVAYYGAALIALAAFNLVFLPMYYKNGYKVGISFLLGTSAMLVVICICETLVYIPTVGEFWDSTAPEMLIRQLPVLFAGVAAFAFGTFIACRMSIKRFEKVDI